MAIACGWGLHCRDSQSDKFYRLFLYPAEGDAVLITHYGRVGTDGTWWVKGISSTSQALATAKYKTHERTSKKGYSLSEPFVRFEMVVSDPPLHDLIGVAHVGCGVRGRSTSRVLAAAASSVRGRAGWCRSCGG